MYKIIKTELKLTKEQKRFLKLQTHIAKNVYNISLYELRQEYFKSHRILGYQEIKERIKNNPNYKLMHPYIAAVIINDSVKALRLYSKYHNYDGTIKEYYKNNDLALKSNFPSYKKKNSFFRLAFIISELQNNKRNQSYNIPLSYLFLNSFTYKKKYNDNLLDKFFSQSHLTKTPDLEIILPRILYKKKIKSVSIIPKLNGELFEMQYLYEVKNTNTISKGKEDMAIDLGVTNLATCVTTNNDSFIIDGKIAKSIIRLYNKKISEAKKKLPFVPKTNKTRQLKHSKYINNLYHRLECKMYIYINTSVNLLLTRARKNNVGRIILGWNEGFKESGIKNDLLSNKTKAHINQSFIGLPLAKFRDTLIKKSDEMGIDLVITSEEFTSKVSFYDDEPLNYHEYWGNRIMRGLYKRPNGKLINADINGALNIYRKFITERNANMEKLKNLMCSGVLTPDRVRVIKYS